jgi:hypothetical protein
MCVTTALITLGVHQESRHNTCAGTPTGPAGSNRHFREGLFTAQSTDNAAGVLNAQDATGVVHSVTTGETASSDLQPAFTRVDAGAVRNAHARMAIPQMKAACCLRLSRGIGEASHEPTQRVEFIIVDTMTPET